VSIWICCGSRGGPRACLPPAMSPKQHEILGALVGSSVEQLSHDVAEVERPGSPLALRTIYISHWLARWNEAVALLPGAGQPSAA
jgi:hypothetical protein